MCQNQTSGWGWENNQSCIGIDTCNDQWGDGGPVGDCGTSSSSSSSSSSSNSSSSSSSSSSSGGGSNSVTVHMSGTVGDESVSLQIGGQTIQTWTLTAGMMDYAVNTDATGELRVAFTNDSGNTDRDVQVDYVIVNGVTLQAEDQTDNTGVYSGGQCGGVSFSEWLHCNGSIGFGNPFDEDPTGSATPRLHVEGRHLKNPSGENVVLRGGWMQPTETWFNGGGRWYSNPTDWTNPSNVAGLLNYLKEAATLMTDPSPRYGRDHGWYSSFVRVNTDSIGGWTQQSGLVNQAQFDGWIQNFVVPYADHLRSRGLYLVLSATGPINTPNNGSRNAGVTEQARLRTFWRTVANAPGVKNADNIMFELMNEPVEIESSPGNGDWGMGQAKYFSAFRDWIQPVINDIQSTGANNVIWVPTLEWQGSPQQHVQYPFTCSNCGVAVHYYPAYGGCYDSVDCHNNLWNRQYKPTAELWPMIITENFWFPENDGLVAGSTANYGNTLRANMTASGNVSYMIGFLSDLIYVNDARPADAGLESKEGAQAAFTWFYEDNTNSCAPASITPYLQVNNGSWQQTSSVTLNSGNQVRFGPHPVSGGSWSWGGCGTSGSAREQTISPTGSCTATSTYTNTCGAQSTQNFNVTIGGA